MTAEQDQIALEWLRKARQTMRARGMSPREVEAATAKQANVLLNRAQRLRNLAGASPEETRATRALLERAERLERDVNQA